MRPEYTTLWTVWVAVGAFLGPGIAFGQPAAQKAPPATQPGPIDKEGWARRLAGLKGGDWDEIQRAGEELADLPGDEGFGILKANWERIKPDATRRGLVFSWCYVRPAGPAAGDSRRSPLLAGSGPTTLPTPVRIHPRMLDVIDLGMHDGSPDVQRGARRLLAEIFLRDFGGDYRPYEKASYEEWYKTARTQPVMTVITESVRGCVAEVLKGQGPEAERGMRLLEGARLTFRDLPEARQAALDAGVLKIMERSAAVAKDRNADWREVQAASNTLFLLQYLKVNEADLRRLALPLLGNDVPPALRDRGIRALGRKEFPWAMDALTDALRATLESDDRRFAGEAPIIAQTLAETGDPKAIPVLIGVMEALNSGEQMLAIAWMGLCPLTGVTVSATQPRNGIWWRQWWEKNRQKYPLAVQQMRIPKFRNTMKHQVQPVMGGMGGGAVNGGSRPSR